MPRNAVVALLTDFGHADGYVGAMKGVILQIDPLATIVDVTHDVPRGDVLAGAIVLRQVIEYFPAGTVHCVVVDPTVGTDRRILAARYAGQTVVCPDNGLISLVNRDLPLEAIAVVRDERYFINAPISTTFHGRDIMAPVAAHLAGGLPLARLGPPPETFHIADIPQPHRQPDGSLGGQVLYVDHFGNLVTNIGVDDIRAIWPDLLRTEVFCGDRSVGTVLPSYAHAAAGQPLALVNSMSLLEVAVHGGSAREVLSAGVGTAVRIVRTPE